MDRLWSEVDATDVVSMHCAIGEPRSLTKSTIHSTLERLVRKRLVSRHRSGRAYHYTATLNRSDWISEVMDAVIGDLGTQERDEVLAGFVNFADRTSETALASLAELIQMRIDERSLKGDK